MTEYGLRTIWMIFIAIGIGTYGLRLSFILILGRMGDPPPYLSGLLRFIPATVLAALIAPTLAVLSVDPGVGFEVDYAKVAACLVAVGIAWRTENVLATICGGLGVLWAVQAVV